MAPLRMLNRKLGTEFPLEGPKTLNGLIVEYLGEIPDAGISFRLAGQGGRSAAGPGPRGQGRQAAAPGRPCPGAAFTNHGRAGIIDKLTFMHLE